MIQEELGIATRAELRKQMRPFVKEIRLSNNSLTSLGIVLGLTDGLRCALLVAPKRGSQFDLLRTAGIGTVLDSSIRDKKEGIDIFDRNASVDEERLRLFNFTLTPLSRGIKSEDNTDIYVIPNGKIEESIRVEYVESPDTEVNRPRLLRISSPHAFTDDNFYPIGVDAIQRAYRSRLRKDLP